MNETVLFLIYVYIAGVPSVGGIILNIFFNPSSSLFWDTDPFDSEMLFIWAKSSTLEKFSVVGVLFFIALAWPIMVLGFFTSGIAGAIKGSLDTE